MNFLADESVDQPIVERLRKDGHLVLYVAEMSPSISDPEVLDLAKVDKLLCWERKNSIFICRSFIFKSITETI